MKQLNQIMGGLNNKRLKDSFRIGEIYKKVVSPQISQRTSSITYKNKELHIEISDNAWANELINLKSTLIKKLREQFGEIRDIRIKVSFQRQENKKDDEINENHRCKKCGSLLITRSSVYCALCVDTRKNEKRYEIFQIIKETPWISYKEISESDRKSFTEQDFYREKKFQIRKIYDIINQGYMNIKCNNLNADLNYFREKVEELVIIKLNLQPEKLRETIIEQNISPKWYKIYKSKDS